jgi:hypothetical protein
MGNFLEKYFNSEYTFTPFIPELVKPLGKNKGLILANLLNKLETFNPENTTHKIYGKAFHFYYSKKDIAKEELLIDYSDFNRYMGELSDYVTEFGGRQKGDKGYNTTYFFLHIDRIKTLFEEGAAMLGKKTKKQIPAKLQPPKQAVNHRLPEHITTTLKSINDTELKYQRGDISEAAYSQTIGEKIGLIRQNKFNIQQNKESKLWEITP